MTDARNFLINTDYPMDKIIYMTSGSAVVNFSDEITIAHGLGFAPLVFGIWSLNSDFSTSQEFDMMSSDLYSPDYMYVTGLEADATNIYASFQNSEFSDVTFYYRIYAFEPSDEANAIAPTSSNTLTTNLLVDTDLNYLKLHSSGIKVVSSAPDTVTHNLGYLPTVMIWKEGGGVHAGSIYPIYQPTIYVHADYAIGYPLTPSVTDTTISFPTTGTYHYRIYADEA